MKVVSINIASIGNLLANEEGQVRRLASAIAKRPAAGPIMAGVLGLAGDQQADRKVHGGPNKAIYAYPLEHYPFWQEQRSRLLRLDDALPPGALGENLSMQGLLEPQVWVGDRLNIGNAVLEVTQPRTPCFKLAVKMGFTHAPKAMLQSGATGFYLRVVQAGYMQAGDTISLRPGPRCVSIEELNRKRHNLGQYDLF